METAPVSRKRDAIRTQATATVAAACSSIKRARVLGGVDRLGDLPDCLLHEILSLLGSRQAARTSALSRRWRHLWRAVPCLNIDQLEFLRPDVVPDDDSELDVSEWESFEDMAPTPCYPRRRRRRWTRSACTWSTNADPLQSPGGSAADSGGARRW
jgi:hypothetical protein